MAHTYLLHYIGVLRKAKLRLTLDHFIKKFGDQKGEHIYKKWKGYQGDLVELFSVLDHANQKALADLIEEVAKD